MLLSLHWHYQLTTVSALTHFSYPPPVCVCLCPSVCHFVVTVHSLCAPAPGWPTLCPAAPAIRCRPHKWWSSSGPPCACAPSGCGRCWRNEASKQISGHRSAKWQQLCRRKWEREWGDLHKSFKHLNEQFQYKREVLHESVLLRLASPAGFLHWHRSHTGGSVLTALGTTTLVEAYHFLSLVSSPTPPPFSVSLTLIANHSGKKKNYLRYSFQCRPERKHTSMWLLQWQRAKLHCRVQPWRLCMSFGK